MIEQFILLSHIIVVGYWLGAEFVINSTYRYVSWASDMPFPTRAKLMDHVMIVDQHVRYALVLQAGLGAMLGALYGYIPGGAPAAGLAGGLGLAWLILVEVSHRTHSSPIGNRLAGIDRTIRYLVIAGLVFLFGSVLFGSADLPLWLAWKLLFFAGVIACGVIIRLYLLRFFRLWSRIAETESTESDEIQIRQIYWGATSALLGLWVFIIGIVALSFTKLAPF